MTHSAKSVRSSDGLNWQATAQGNITNARSNIKRHHNQAHRRSVGGTDNLIRAAFGLDGKPMCAVATTPVHGVNVGAAYGTNPNNYTCTTPGVRRSDYTVEHGGTCVTGMSWDYIMRKCTREDITLVEYCERYDFPLAAIAALAPTA